MVVARGIRPGHLHPDVAIADGRVGHGHPPGVGITRVGEGGVVAVLPDCRPVLPVAGNLERRGERERWRLERRNHG